jgi:hypothetical protein
MQQIFKRIAVCNGSGNNPTSNSGIWNIFTGYLSSDMENFVNKLQMLNM